MATKKSAPSKKPAPSPKPKASKKAAPPKGKPAHKKPVDVPDDHFLMYVEGEVRAILDDAGVVLTKGDVEELSMVIAEGLELPVGMLVASMIDAYVGPEDDDE